MEFKSVKKRFLLLNLLSDPNNPYPYVIATLKKTGCLTPIVEDGQLNWWLAQSDSVAFSNMLWYCQRVLSSTANELEATRCCGSMDCSVSECTLQTGWSDGKYKNVKYSQLKSKG